MTTITIDYPPFAAEQRQFLLDRLRDLETQAQQLIAVTYHDDLLRQIHANLIEQQRSLRNELTRLHIVYGVPRAITTS